MNMSYELQHIDHVAAKAIKNHTTTQGEFYNWMRIMNTVKFTLKNTGF
jgi:hypothetical protein